MQTLIPQFGKHNTMVTQASLEFVAWCTFHADGIIGSLLVYGVLW